MAVSAMTTEEKKRCRKKQLYHDIIKLVEFYFSPSNLSKDRFMTRALADNSNGIELQVLMTFNKLKSLTMDINILTKALRLSDILELTDNETRVKSKVDFKPKENEDECTIYVERLPLDANVDFMQNAFSHFGQIDYVSLPKFHNGKLKGFGFVEFSDPSYANHAIEEFKKTGNYLPIDMAPGNLRSICTFDKKAKERFLASKQKHFDYDDCSNMRCDDEMNMAGDENFGMGLGETSRMENFDSDDNEKKRKHKTSPSTLERKMKKIKSDDDEPEETNTVSNNISENVSDQSAPEVIVVKEAEKLIDNSETKSAVDLTGKVVENVTDASLVNEVPPEQFKHGADVEMSDQVDDNLDEKIKKKRRQKKKLKKDRQSVNSGLFILSKADWKKLRNKYLNIQWEKMRSLKKHLYNCRQHAEIHSNVDQFNNGFGMSSYVEIPRSVVMIIMDEPVVDVKVFKADIRSKGNDIVNIDVKEGSNEVYIRFNSADSAQGFISDNKDMKTTTITGGEEERYWSKIYTDRENKKEKKNRKAEFSHDEEKNKAEIVGETKPQNKGLKDKPTLGIVPGTVVKIHTSEPITNLKQFKNDVKKSCKNIVYVDAIEGCCEAFARLETADNAKLFSSDTSFGKVNILSGKEEESYWSKINDDRTNKFNKNVRTNRRGKQKIIKNAEKLVGKHILFEDTDEMIVSRTD